MDAEFRGLLLAKLSQLGAIQGVNPCPPCTHVCASMLTSWTREPRQRTLSGAGRGRSWGGGVHGGDL